MLETAEASLKRVNTVDGQNPAPPGKYKTLQFMGYTFSLNCAG